MVARSALGGLEPLAQGGTARIYRVPGYSLPGAGQLVYKEYRAKVRAKAGRALLPGLLALTEFRVRLPPGRREQVDRRTIWPLRVVTGEDDAATGILMREIPGEFFHGREPRELHILFHAEGDAREQGLPCADFPARLAICARIAAIYMLLHQAGVIVGDVSARNAVFTGGTAPHVLVLDTDSCRVKGTRGAFGTQPHTPFWEPPEALAAERQFTQAKRAGSASPARLRELSDTWQRQTQQTDVYKFGLIIVRLLDYGRYRSQNRNPERACEVLRDHAAQAAGLLLIRSLDSDPGNRPAMLEWYRAFRLRPGSPGTNRNAQASPGNPRTADHSPAGPAMRAVGDWRFVDGTGWVRR